MIEKTINNLPYRARIYINNQVLLPANLVKALNLEWVRYANIVISHRDAVIELEKVLLLRTKRTASRQFTIPKEIREKYGIMPLDEIEIISIEPIKARKSKP
ncbi:hypothetical protein [Vulcanisaeta souniana]|uniref:AbrB family transcriptional regulator n=1 Tax=Vulcanisaeta souniana JCM 11219 TaxID=1293586 RepID=A0A830E5Q9_9CREN|nr:hypothetical protein [Vulcanisaeta souniana]BDR92896.1 hypothetical protein Vsou_19890 [Vulcanisaeta souniana JCM 11219]GGI85465.1 hypothetical protein GCM10007112_23120 [Vulcanisaeta souniana JCM 11219]